MNRYAIDLPKIGIRPCIDGRRKGVREGLETQTMKLDAYDKEITFWYAANTDVDYQVNYLEKGTGKELQAAKKVLYRTFDTEVTEKAANIFGYTLVSDASVTLM